MITVRTGLLLCAPLLLTVVARAQPAQEPAVIPPPPPAVAPSPWGQWGQANAWTQAAPWGGQAAGQPMQGMSMGGCGMGGMSGMGGMGGMSGMSGMSMPSMGMGSMPMTQPGIGHATGEGLGMREVVSILTMQDTLQVVEDLLRITERLVPSSARDEEALRREIDQARQRIRDLTADYRRMLSEQVAGD